MRCLDIFIETSMLSTFLYLTDAIYLISNLLTFLNISFGVTANFVDVSVYQSLRVIWKHCPSKILTIISNKKFSHTYTNAKTTL